MVRHLAHTSRLAVIWFWGGPPHIGRLCISVFAYQRVFRTAVSGRTSLGYFSVSAKTGTWRQPCCRNSMRQAVIYEFRLDSIVVHERAYAQFGIIPPFPDDSQTTLGLACPPVCRHASKSGAARRRHGISRARRRGNSDKTPRPLPAHAP